MLRKTLRKGVKTTGATRGFAINLHAYKSNVHKYSKSPHELMI